MSNTRQELLFLDKSSLWQNGLGLDGCLFPFYLWVEVVGSPKDRVDSPNFPSTQEHFQCRISMTRWISDSILHPYVLQRLGSWERGHRCLEDILLTFNFDFVYILSWKKFFLRDPFDFSLHSLFLLQSSPFKSGTIDVNIAYHLCQIENRSFSIWDSTDIWKNWIIIHKFKVGTLKYRIIE